MLDHPRPALKHRSQAMLRRVSWLLLPSAQQGTIRRSGACYGTLLSAVASVESLPNDPMKWVWPSAAAVGAAAVVLFAVVVVTGQEV